MYERVANVGRSGTRALEFAAPAVDLLLRLWVANVFFKSGLTKIANFDSTISHLLVTIVHGGGKLALDHWVGRFWPMNASQGRTQWAR